MDVLRKVIHKSSGAELTLWDTNKTDRMGKCVLGYSLEYCGEFLFRGEDFSCSPMVAIDSDEAVLAILGFLTLRPGDTDREYFDDYTKSQLEWANSGECENMQCDCACLENPNDSDNEFTFLDIFTEVEVA